MLKLYVNELNFIKIRNIFITSRALKMKKSKI